MELTDEQIELLIDHSDGHWREDTFRIDGPSLTALLRAAAKAASADVSRDSIIEECAAVIAPKGDAPCGCMNPKNDHMDYGCSCHNSDDARYEATYWEAQANADRIRALKRQSNSPRGDK